MVEDMAEGAVLSAEDGLDVVDGVVLFVKPDDPFTGRAAFGRCFGQVEEVSAGA